MTARAASFAAGLALVASLGAIALAQPTTDPRIASTDVAEVCASDGLPGSAYSRAHRVVKRAGRQGYQHDHILPLCLGGADVEANLEWQPIDEAEAKDRLEWFACREVCAGRVSLATARGWFLYHDWIAHKDLPR